MASNLKQIENLNITEIKDVSTFYTINGGLISWNLINERTNPSFSTNSLSHFWSIVGGYSDNLVERYNTSYSEGGFKGTSLEEIYYSYNNTGMIVGVIDSNTYRKGLVGNDFAMNISISGGTGPLSGLTGTTLYSTFFNQPQMLRKQEGGQCSLTLADTLYFETLQDAVITTGIGQSLSNSNTEKEYQSGVVFLFSDDLSFTSGSTTGQSFSTAHQSKNPYLNGKLLAEFTGSKYHKAVGMVDCISGLVCIWDRYLVDSFAWGLGTGGTGTTMVTFPPTINYGNIKDIDSSVSAIIQVKADPYQFISTTNPSRDEAVKSGVDCEEQIQITEVCLWDGTGKCTAIGTPNNVVTKNEKGYFIVDLVVSLDGGITDNPYLVVNGGLGVYLPT